MKSKALAITMLIFGIVVLLANMYFEWSRRWNLNVYIVPYTTIDSFAFEAEGMDTQQKANQIIESVLFALDHDIRYRFSWPETQYFATWYEQADIKIKDLMKKMIQQNKFYFVNGGWVIHDETSINYKSAINQMVLGQDFLQNNFGIIPHIGWQMDSVGNSATTPSIFAMLGIDALATSQIGDQPQKRLTEDQQLNFVWEGHQIDDNMDPYRVFTHPTAHGYEIGFPFGFHSKEEDHCDKIYIDFAHSKKFFDTILSPNIDAYDASEDIVLLYGGPNFFTDAKLTYFCIDSYMAEVQRLTRNWTDFKYMSYKFSTFDEYLIETKKVYKHQKINSPFYNSEFLPYEHSKISNSFLSNKKNEYKKINGFYSNKIMLRQKSRTLGQHSSILSSVLSINEVLKKAHNYKRNKRIFEYKEMITAKQNAASLLDSKILNDEKIDSNLKLQYYSKFESTKVDMDSIIVNRTLDTLALLFKKEPHPMTRIDVNPELNYFLDGKISKDLYPVIIYNPSLQDRTEIVNLTIEAVQAAVFDKDLNSVISQLTPFSTFKFSDQNSRILRDNLNRFVHFEVSLKPLETKIYFVRHIFDEQDCENKYKHY